MTFPYNDPLWREAAGFILDRRQPDESVLAPDIFHYVFEHIHRDVNTWLHPTITYDWVVVNLHDFGRQSAHFLSTVVPTTMHPVFANHTFVVWSARSNTRVQPISTSATPVLRYFASVHELGEGYTTMPDLSAEPVLPDLGAIFEFDQLGGAALARTMDDFWAHGGYEQTTLRDRVLKHEMERIVARFAGDGAGRTVLGVGCGRGIYRDIITNSPSIVGIDISTVAIELARADHDDRPEFTFHVMDAQAMSFSDESFELVLFVDAIEHVLDVRLALSEVHRVLQPGGHLLVTSANSESVHLVMNSALGYSDFRTSFQHIREFSHAELSGLLVDVGFECLDSAGVLLYPYWGIPGVDSAVRHLTDENPEVVEMTRLLGTRIGPEHSYEFAIWARKVGTAA